MLERVSSCAIHSATNIHVIDYGSNINYDFVHRYWVRPPKILGKVAHTLKVTKKAEVKYLCIQFKSSVMCSPDSTILPKGKI